MTPFKMTLTAGLVAVGALPAAAAEMSVKMLNQGPGGMMVFEPALVKIKPGDSVKFTATDKGHNVETIKGMAPEGAPEVKGAIGKDETVTFEKEGVYAFKCAPHFSMGMVVLVAVGDKLDNLAQVKSAQVSPGAKKRLEPLFAQVEAK